MTSIFFHLLLLLTSSPIIIKSSSSSMSITSRATYNSKSKILFVRNKNNRPWDTFIRHNKENKSAQNYIKQKTVLVQLIIVM
jgi:hypothetical protein